MINKIQEYLNQLKKNQSNGFTKLTYTRPEEQKKEKIGETWSFELINSDEFDNVGLRNIQSKYSNEIKNKEVRVYPLLVDNLPEALDLLEKIFKEFGDSTVLFDASKINTQYVNSSDPVFVVIVINNEYKTT